jgi:hypothetical protein
MTHLSGTFAGCVLAGRARDDQLMGPARVTVAVRWGPGLTVRCGTLVARSARTEALWRKLSKRGSGAYLESQLRSDALPALLGACCLPGELIDQLVHRVARVALHPAKRDATLPHDLDERLPQVSIDDRPPLTVDPVSWSQPSHQRSRKQLMRYVESLTTSRGPSRALAASSTAVISMRWFVVRALAPLVYRPRGTAHAHPPGPGFPEHAPSVYTTVAAGTGTTSWSTPTSPLVPSEATPCSPRGSNTCADRSHDHRGCLGGANPKWAAVDVDRGDAGRLRSGPRTRWRPGFSGKAGRTQTPSRASHPS